MKTSTVVSTIVILLIAAGSWYYLANIDMTPLVQDQAQVPAGGQPDTGVIQQPMADGAEGSIIGANLALGLDGVGTKAHLIGYNGMTLYTKDGDTATTSSCYGQCATNWPPYLVGPEDNVNNVKAGVGGKVDTIFRTDNSIQVTYNGKPLYFYASDKTSADVTGDGVGGVWHVAK